MDGRGRVIYFHNILYLFDFFFSQTNVFLPRRFEMKNFLRADECVKQRYILSAYSIARNRFLRQACGKLSSTYCRVFPFLGIVPDDSGIDLKSAAGRFVADQFVFLFANVQIREQIIDTAATKATSYIIGTA